MTRSTTRRGGALTMATCCFTAYTAVMLRLERRMRLTGGPGIVPFELAGNPTRAAQIMTRWGPDGRRAARLSLWLDFGYMSTYGALTALLLEHVRRMRGHPAALTAVVIPAVAADAVEGVSLLKVLDGSEVDVHARRARSAAIVKFVVLGCAIGYCLIGGSHRLVSA
ncbi:hypothetical protein [Mycobacterium sp. GA-1285]|uniref:hypothetical protein n=1 Tax=Mycobacterium sp. GA-1285 TaxID=1772282 RepID=UPI000B118BC5|nr:hypothetical protein [Mycobacterium sp. GA-1285]